MADRSAGHSARPDDDGAQTDRQPSDGDDPTEVRSTLPFPVRVAAGAISAAVETARRLPDDLPVIGVELAGTLTKWVMSVRHRLDDLASRGDELLVGTPPASERPPWATFDDDLPAEPSPVDADQHRRDNEPDSEADTAPAAASAAASNTAGAAAGVTGSDVTTPAAGADDLAQWDTLPLRQLRALLPTLSHAELTERLERERSHAQRPSVLTMLTNRLRSLEHDGT